MVATEIKIFWIIGFALSLAGLLFQIVLYILVPCSRKLDQKLLTQLTVARILNIIFEYLVTNLRTTKPEIREPIFGLYAQTDAALLCWMFVFTKNLYDKVVLVFTQKYNFTLLSVCVWIITVPIGLLCPLLLSLDHGHHKEKPDYFKVFYQCYSVIKFLILTVNLLLFCKIFKVVVSRSDRNAGILRTCVVAFILVSIASVQVFITDLLSFVLDEFPRVSLAFAVVNSYQVIAITTIFVILVNGACEDSLRKTISKKFIKETV